MAQGTWPHVCQYNLDYHGCNQVYMPIGGPPLSEVAGSCASFDARSYIHGMEAVSQGTHHITVCRSVPRPAQPWTLLAPMMVMVLASMTPKGQWSHGGHGYLPYDPYG